MGQQSKRTRAPAPHLIPPSAPHLTSRPAAHLVPPPPQPVPPPPQPVRRPAFPSTHGQGAWIPLASTPWLARPQGPLWVAPAGSGDSSSHWHTAENVDDTNPQVWGVDSHPPGGFLSFFENTPNLAQAVSNGGSSQPINEEDGTNGGDCARTEKRLMWTKEEDLRLWLEV